MDEMEVKPEAEHTPEGDPEVLATPEVVDPEVEAAREEEAQFEDSLPGHTHSDVPQPDEAESPKAVSTPPIEEASQRPTR